MISHFGVGVFSASHRAHRGYFVRPFGHIFPHIFVDGHVGNGDSLVWRIPYVSLVSTVLTKFEYVVGNIGGRAQRWPKTDHLAMDDRPQGYPIQQTDHFLINARRVLTDLLISGMSCSFQSAWLWSTVICLQHAMLTDVSLKRKKNCF